MRLDVVDGVAAHVCDVKTASTVSLAWKYAEDVLQSGLLSVNSAKRVATCENVCDRVLHIDQLKPPPEEEQRKSKCGERSRPIPTPQSFLSPSRWVLSMDDCRAGANFDSSRPCCGQIRE
jgi:hypothetical protein